MEQGTLWLAKQVGDNPSAYTLDQLQGAVLRLFEAKRRSRHSARAQARAYRRVDAIQAEIKKRLAGT